MSDLSRTSKNKDIYDSLYNEDQDLNIDELELKENEVSLGTSTSEMTREDYRKRELQAGISRKEDIREKIEELEKKELEKEKIYDINKVIEKAKKERDKEEDIRNTQYNILNSLDITGDLEQTISDTKEILNIDKEKINDIIEEASEEVNDLAEDLFATDNVVVASVSQETVTEINEDGEEEIVSQETEITTVEEVDETDDTFFDGTVSINRRDIEADDESYDEKEKGNSVVVKILLVLVILVCLAFLGYLGYRFFL